MPIQRLVLARIGLPLAPINKEIAQFQHTQTVCNQQDLHKQPFQLHQKPLAETVNAVVTGCRPPAL
jgi:hypothetical protein